MAIIRLIVYSNILISLAAGSLSFGMVSFLNCSNPSYYFLSVFFATLFIYNFQRVPRLSEVNDQYSDRHIWLSKNKSTLYLFIFIGLLGSGIVYFQFLTVKNDLVFLVIIGVIGVFYALKTINGNALRDYPYIKIHLIALVWVLVVAVWPLIREEKLFSEHLSLLIGLYLIMIAITIPFDIRDLNYDDPKKKTAPQLIGVKWSKRVAATSLFFGYVLLTIYSNLFLQNTFFYLSFIGFFILIIRANKELKELYFSGLIDGWIILLGLAFLFNC